PPVMPWTMTLESLVRKIGMSFGPYSSASAGSQFGGLVGAFVHCLRQRHQRVRGIGEDLATLVHAVTVETDHQRLVRVVAQDLERLADAVRDGVTRGDATEDVHE